MARTTSFREQHKELLALVQQISALLNPSDAGNRAEDIRKTLSTLAGKLNIHLAMEDKNLYPDMIASQNAQAKQAAEKFMAEMGSLSEAFKAYTQKWPTASSIKDNPSEFCNQTKAVFKALGDRVQREEAILYNLADQI